MKSKKPVDKSGMIGSNRGFKQLLDDAERAAKYDFSILLFGESGTGKSRIARFIHQNSPRNCEPFVTVDAGALPADLVESELFGHTKGSFTGAVSGKTGLFKQADHGTVFLDEITNASLSVQAKLLRVLQERVIRRVGSLEDEPVDVRIVAATNKNVKKLIDDGRFRSDLYYRLKSVVLNVPPLRQRMEDFKSFVDHFLNIKSAPDGMVKIIEPGALNFLVDYPLGWPGNIRELESTIERLVALTTGDTITYDETVAIISRQTLEYDKETAEPAMVPDLRRARAMWEKTHILKILNLSDGNRKQAAARLGISYKQLLRKVRDYGIV